MLGMYLRYSPASSRPTEISGSRSVSMVESGNVIEIDKKEALCPTRGHY